MSGLPRATDPQGPIYSNTLTQPLAPDRSGSVKTSSQRKARFQRLPGHWWRWVITLILAVQATIRLWWACYFLSSHLQPEFQYIGLLFSADILLLFFLGLWLWRSGQKGLPVVALYGFFILASSYFTWLVDTAVGLLLFATAATATFLGINFPGRISARTGLYLSLGFCLSVSVLINVCFLIALL